MGLLYLSTRYIIKHRHFADIGTRRKIGEEYRFAPDHLLDNH